MDRLLAGDKGRTNGAKTWSNVYRLAGVAKATANRAADLREEWKRKVREHELAAARPGANEIKRKGPTQAQVVDGLRETARRMAEHIQALSVTVDRQEQAIRDRDAIIADLRRRLALASGITIVPLRRE
jgi:hypothetical protein